MRSAFLGDCQTSAELWYKPKGRKGAPDALRHSMQWHAATATGSVLLVYTTEPQAQLPCRAGWRA